MAIFHNVAVIISTKYHAYPPEEMIATQSAVEISALVAVYDKINLRHNQLWNLWENRYWQSMSLSYYALLDIVIGI